jgi:hypothetical protein
MSEAGRSRRVGGLRTIGIAALAGALYCTSAGLAQVAPAVTPLNPFNDELLKSPPEQQAAKLADQLGVWCIGTKPFFMGMTKSGKAKGYAYWSLTCAGAKAYLIQIEPNGHGEVIDCARFRAGSQGRECYKTF